MKSKSLFLLLILLLLSMLIGIFIGENFAVVTYAQLVHDKIKIITAVHTAKKAGQAFSKENLSKALELLSDGQSSFRYVSNKTLTYEYFQAACNSLDDEHIYIVLTDSGSPASELISIFTKRQFNHASLSFDKALQTIVRQEGKFVLQELHLE